MSPRTRALLLAVLAFLTVRLVWLYIVPAWNAIVTDFPNYYVSAWAVRHGEPLTELYDPLWFDLEKHRAGIERPAALFNYFPPMNALIMWPLADLSPITAKRAFTVVNLIALIGIVHLTSRSSGLKWEVAALVALLGGDALGNNFTYGQFYIVLAFLMLLSVALSKRYPAIAGFSAAVGAMTKIFPGFLLLYFAIRREYRALMWSVLALALLAGLGFIALGWEPHRTYLIEVFARSMRGEVGDPYNIHWNTLQALVRRALVGDDLLNPHPIVNAPWLFFFVRPLISFAVAAVTLYAIFQARQRHPLLSYGAVIAMVSLVTPSQASYHQFLFYPTIAWLVTREGTWVRRVFPAVLFAMLCSNYMGATAHYDSGVSMILAFPRVFIILVLWMICLWALDPPAVRVSNRLVALTAIVLAVCAALAFSENRRWSADVSDGATHVPSSWSASSEIRPRFVRGRLVTSVLSADGFADSGKAAPEASTSPDGKWTAFASNERGNWDIAIRSNQSGEIRYLTSSSGNDLTPAFSPDGKFVYFASDRHRGYRFTTIYRVSVDGR